MRWTAFAFLLSTGAASAAQFVPTLDCPPEKVVWTSPQQYGALVFDGVYVTWRYEGERRFLTSEGDPDIMFRVAVEILPDEKNSQDPDVFYNFFSSPKPGFGPILVWDDIAFYPECNPPEE